VEKPRIHALTRQFRLAQTHYPLFCARLSTILTPASTGMAPIAASGGPNGKNGGLLSLGGMPKFFDG
jgi:hypothetical protein